MKPLRILHVVITMNAGGIETMLMNLYRSIDKSKLQFDFLVHTDRKSFYDDEIVKLGGQIHRIKPLKLQNLIEYRKQLNTFFEKEDYKIVHSHISVWSYFVLSSAKNNKVPIRIAHSHEAHSSIWEHRLHRIPLVYILKKYISKPLTHKFACGKEAGIWLYGNKSKFKVINNAINAKKFIFDRKKSILIKTKLDVLNKFVIGHVGRFNTQKNHNFLIDIFYEFLKLEPNAILLLIGDGDLKQKIINKVNHLSISDKVKFLGVRSDIPDLLQAFDLFLFPSLFEGLPVTLIEAQASDLKILASKSISAESNLTESVEFLSLKNNAKEWAQTILMNQNYRRKNNFNVIKNKGYDIDNNALELQNFYLNTVNNA